MVVCCGFQVATSAAPPTSVKGSKAWTPFTDRSTWWLTTATCASFLKVRPSSAPGSSVSIYIGSLGGGGYDVIVKDLFVGVLHKNPVAVKKKKKKNFKTLEVHPVLGWR